MSGKLKRLRQSLLVVLAAAQLIVPNLVLFVDGLVPIGEQSRVAPPPENPAGCAFLIWFVIFALCMAYAIRQAAPSQRDNILYERIGWLTVGAIGANVAWMTIGVLIGNGWVLAAII